MQEVNVSIHHRVAFLQKIEKFLLMVQLQGDSILGKAPQKLISWNFHGTIIPTMELPINIKQLCKTFILVLAYCSYILKYVVGPEIRVFNRFNIGKICELLAHLTVRDSSISIFIKDRY